MKNISIFLLFCLVVLTSGIDRGREDGFGNLSINKITNKINISSDKRYNPERHRVYVDGQRQLIQYADIIQYNHAGDVHELKPSAGEKVLFRGAERFRYQVNFELLASFSYTLNQTLNAGDTIRVGLFDHSNGWFYERDGSMTMNEARLVVKRAGERKLTKTVILAKHDTIPTRLGLTTNWYAVGRQLWRQTFTEDNKNQLNQVIGATAIQDRSTKVSTLPPAFEVVASGTTNNLVMEVGSFSGILIGEADGVTKQKVATFEANITTTDEWVPILAIRTNPKDSIINTQLTNVAIGKFTGSGDVQVVVMAYDPSNVFDSDTAELTDSDYSTPVLHSPSNSVIEHSTAVSLIPDSSNTTVTSTTDPGGWQVGYASLYTTGQGNSTTQVPTNKSLKRNIYPLDIAVVLVKSSATGDIEGEYTTSQEW